MAMGTALRSMTSEVRAAVLVAFAILAATPSPVQAQVQPLPPHSVVEGKRLDQWSDEWWKWMLSMSGQPDPTQDITGAAANRAQSGPVFFLANKQVPGQVSRSFTVPQGKHLYVP